MEKCGVLHSGGNDLRNRASYTLDQQRTLTANHIQRIEWYCVRLPIRLLEVPKIAFRTVEFGLQYRIQQLTYHTISAFVEFLVYSSVRSKKIKVCTKIDCISVLLAR